MKRKILLIIFVALFCSYLPSLEAITKSNRGESRKYDKMSIQKIYEAGREYADKENYKKALHLYNIVIDRQKIKRLVDPDFQADLFYHMSLAYLKTGENEYFNYGNKDSFKKSLEYAEACLGINPHYWQAFENMALVYSRMRQLDRADFYYGEVEKFLDQESLDYKRIAKRHKMIRKVIQLKKEKENIPTDAKDQPPIP